MKVAGNCNLTLKNLTIEEVIAVNAFLEGLRRERRGLPEKAKNIRPRGRPAKTAPAPVPSDGEKIPCCDDRDLYRKIRGTAKRKVIRESAEDNDTEIALQLAKCAVKA